ncbi:beta-ketoacyl synthase N-terminal-like domain-containing protein [Actinokineospora auranticolor]|uniref:Phosphopantetheine binding protein n=1 Tax=Actinokineospora auranticolor TaxID=155976 RepID=A0A2S6GPL8_9PSEU|nr:beta-ketoacyl synthase N-terminal-like domain-containing protein [Actinokineospora auranticolor]PPK67113.1 phosphopantetheine binding protein [Actinokineospora auranticolor]
MTTSDSDIAIIGMACRFPGADSTDRFWEVLREGRETLTRFTDEELLAAGVPAARLADPRYVKAGQTIADVELFDAELFGFTPEEAEILDPQHRVFLECALTALERAGVDPERTEGNIGVYAGAGMNTYLLHNLAARYAGASSVDQYRLMLANDKDFLATRLSYKLNLRGPSLNINTACSTSLVALHTACLGLLGGECDTALVGAVHLGHARQGYQYQDGMIFSPDGHCRAFDARARGTVIGSGAGAVVLKRLADALADGDWIHAVVKGTAVNNDGAGKTGYTAPSVGGQAQVIADAHEVAGVSADRIGYVEAHGTGTPLGDPIEVAALTEAFRRSTDRTGYCALGSVKTNIGHLDTAAGMAGLIKTALLLEHRTLVPSLHFTEPNPDIDFAASPFAVNTETREWASDGPRLAGVSSFGIGGTNAHVVLQEPPTRSTAPQARDRELLVLSGRTEDGLHRATTALARHLRQHRDLDLGAVAQSLGLGRLGRRHRVALVAEGVRDAAMALALGDEERLVRGSVEHEPSAPVPVLTGTAPASTAELYKSVPQYRSAVDELAGSGGAAELLLSSGGPRAAFAHEYALVRTLLAWGVEPTGYAASGPGLAVAAALTGALAPADALALAAGTTPAGFAAPVLPVFSAGTGRWLTDDEAATAAAWTGTGELTAVDGALAGIGGHALHLAPADGTAADLGHLLGLAAAEWVRGADLDFAALRGDDTEAIDAGVPRRVPLPTHQFDRRRHWIDPGAQESAAPRVRERLVDRFDPADPTASLLLVTDHLVDEIGGVLGGRHLAGLDTNLFDLGLDSLVLIEVVAKLSEQLDVEVPATAFVEFPTIRAFVDNLAELLGLAAAPAATAAAAGRTSLRAQRAAALRG